MITDYSQQLHPGMSPTKRTFLHVRSKIILAPVAMTFSVTGFGESHKFSKWRGGSVQPQFQTPSPR